MGTNICIFARLKPPSPRIRFSLGRSPVFRNLYIVNRINYPAPYGMRRLVSVSSSRYVPDCEQTNLAGESPGRNLDLSSYHETHSAPSSPMSRDRTTPTPPTPPAQLPGCAYGQSGVLAITTSTCWWLITGVSKVRGSLK